MCRSFIIVRRQPHSLHSRHRFSPNRTMVRQTKRRPCLKAVAALKADKAKTLDQINHGKGGFLDRDLYVFCINIRDGKLVAVGNPNVKQLLARDSRTKKDVNGEPFGQEMYDAYQKPEGQITEVSYMWAKPGPDKTPVPKVSFVTRIGDLGCGVGYYIRLRHKHHDPAWRVSALPIDDFVRLDIFETVACGGASCHFHLL